jgi:hypothetical protein
MPEIQDAEIQPASSPTPRVMKPVKKEEKKPMSFYEALKYVVGGRKITRLEWKDNQTYGFLKNSELCIKNSKNPIHNRWVISEGDLMGEDWVVLG